MLTRILSPIGRRETLLAATIYLAIFSATVDFITWCDSSVHFTSATTTVVCTALLLYFYHYLAAIFFGDKIVRDVLRHGDSIFGSTIVWAFGCILLSIASTVITCYTFGIATGREIFDISTFFMYLWWAEWMACVLGIPGVLISSLYYTRKLKKIKAPSLLQDGVATDAWKSAAQFDSHTP